MPLILQFSLFIERHPAYAGRYCSVQPVFAESPSDSGKRAVILDRKARARCDAAQKCRTRAVRAAAQMARERRRCRPRTATSAPAVGVTDDVLQI